MRWRHLVPHLLPALQSALAGQGSLTTQLEVRGGRLTSETAPALGRCLGVGDVGHDGEEGGKRGALRGRARKRIETQAYDDVQSMPARSPTLIR